MSKFNFLLIFLICNVFCEIPKKYLQPRKTSDFSLFTRNLLPVEKINIFLRINFYVTQSDSQIIIKSRFIQENLHNRIVILQDTAINYRSIEIIDKILDGRFLSNSENISRRLAIGTSKSISERLFIRPALLVNILLAIEKLAFDKETEDFLIERLIPYTLNFEHCVYLDPACYNFTMTFSQKMFSYAEKMVDKVFMGQCKMEKLLEPSLIPIYSTSLMQNIETCGIINVGFLEMKLLKKQNNDIFWKFWYLKGMSFIKDIFIRNYIHDRIDKIYSNHMSLILNY